MSTYKLQRVSSKIKQNQSNRLFYLLCFCNLLFMNVLTTSCQRTSEREIKEWTGKKIQLTHSVIFSVEGKDTLCPDILSRPYKILLYVDTTGCTDCRLKLSKWREFIKEIDSIAPKKVGFIFLIFTKDLEKLNNLIWYNKFDYPVMIDLLDSINKINHFPIEQNHQCFLLNKDFEVLAIGNPVFNPRIWRTYKRLITH